MRSNRGEAKKLDSPLNDDEVFDSNESKNGDLYYTNISKMKMYYAPNIGGEFPEKKEVDIDFGIHGFISAAQDFLIVDTRNMEDDSRKDRDLYVHFKNEDGTWTKPINLGGEVNSTFSETVPNISPDGKYLFFSRYDEVGGLSNFYWVSSDVIEKLKPKH